ncbi:MULTISPECIES: DUF4249 family protein [Emticicia]|uniref:DUF4249 family protein n=1 Tax=Emticicia TaxID=312278 RepID=UPI0007D8B110|nr:MULTISPECIES: DUF4249 family protein [Emticicia]
MKNINISFFLLSFLIFLGSCTETNTVINPGDKPVVEAYLAPNHPVSLKLYSEIPYSDTSEGVSQPIDGVSIKIIGSNGKTFTLTSQGSGLYTSANNELIGPAGTTYSLEFDFKGRKVRATTEIPSKPINFKSDKTEISRTQIDLSNFTPGSGGGIRPGGGFDQENTSVNLTWSNPNNYYHFVAVENVEENRVQIIIPPSGSSFPSFRFFNEPLIGSSNVVRSQSFQFFGKHDIILYRVNSEYAALYQATGTTSQNLSTPPTSIINGLGIFTGINADTVKFVVNKN